MYKRGFKAIVTTPHNRLNWGEKKSRCNTRYFHTYLNIPVQDLPLWLVQWTMNFQAAVQAYKCPIAINLPPPLTRIEMELPKVFEF